MQANIGIQILQDAADGLKTLTGADFYVYDPDGRLLAKTAAEPAQTPDFTELAADGARCAAYSGYQYFTVREADETQLIAAVKGTDKKTAKSGLILAHTLKTLLAVYTERADAENFIKDLLTDTAAPADIYTRAKRLGIDAALSRFVCLIEIAGGETDAALDILRHMFPDTARDFITAADGKYIVLIKEINENAAADTAMAVYDMLSAEAMSRVYVATGAVVHDIADIPRSYTDVKTALNISKTFEPERYIIDSARLGIGRLLYSLPAGVCEAFMREVMPEDVLSQLDGEMIQTVDKLYENNLNVSEASRLLYIHRNTMVYRLDKLQKVTGLDIRLFKDAVLLKLALMVNQRLMENDK